jgi:hypothetical protein
MTDGVLLRETLKDADLDKYRYVANFSLPFSVFDIAWDVTIYLRWSEYDLPY